jgi:hypothetical protein
MSDTASVANAKPLFRRRRYLLYPFQTRYALAVVLLTAFVVGVISLVFFRLFAGGGITAFAMESDAPEHSIRWLLPWVLVLIASTFGFFYLLFVLASHRIAGPLAVMTRYMSEFASGKYPQIRELRKSDELKEFFEVFKTAVERFKMREVEEITVLRAELKKLKALNLGPASQQLESILQLLIDRRLQLIGREDSSPEDGHVAGEPHSQVG